MFTIVDSIHPVQGQPSRIIGRISGEKYDLTMVAVVALGFHDGLAEGAASGLLYVLIRSSVRG
jgi:hypothetical protein